jgi:hypothetical protein
MKIAPSAIKPFMFIVTFPNRKGSEIHEVFASSEKRGKLMLRDRFLARNPKIERFTRELTKRDIAEVTPSTE